MNRWITMGERLNDHPHRSKAPRWSLEEGRTSRIDRLGWFEKTHDRICHDLSKQRWYSTPQNPQTWLNCPKYVKWEFMILHWQNGGTIFFQSPTKVACGGLRLGGHWQIWPCIHVYPMFGWGHSKSKWYRDDRLSLFDVANFLHSVWLSSNNHYD